MTMFIIFIMVVLLLVKGFFSGSEIALVSADRVKLKHRAAKGHKGAGIANKMLDRPERLLTTTLLGTNASSIALTTIGTVLMVSLFAEQGELFALIIFTPLFLIFGEIIPKSVFQQKANQLAPIIIHPLSWLQTLLMPLIWILSKIAQLVAALLGGNSMHAMNEREQVLAMARMAETSSNIAAFEKGQISRVLHFASMTAGEIMWPLEAGSSLPVTSSIQQLIKLRNKTGQRLIPLYDRATSEITQVACLDVWEMLDPALDHCELKDLLRPVSFVLELQPVNDVYQILTQEPDQVVVVVNESGMSLGLITIQGLIRRSLGAQQSGVMINEEQQRLQPISTVKDGSYLIDARQPVSLVNQALQIELSTLQHSTIGGYIVAQLRHIPKVGERYTEDGCCFEVTKTNERTVLALKAYMET